MVNITATAAPELIGREPELTFLREFLAAESWPVTSVLCGVAGIGKTALWETGVDCARGLGFRVLQARPSGAEMELSFAALADLCDEVDTATLSGVPPPQLRALDVALLRADPGGTRPESFAISAGFTSALRTMSAQQPLVVAIDDVQWLDGPSADVLIFAARRLRGYAVRFLLARRSDAESGLEQALDPLGVERYDVGPLSFGAARVLLSARLGLALPRAVVRRVFETSGGNPLFMLELGRMLVDRGVQDASADLPLPRVVDDLFGTRLAAVSPSVRRLVLAVALAGTLSRSQLTSIGDDAAIDSALETALLVADRDRIRVSHPLLAATATATASAAERREVHAEVATALGDETLRARHLALATTGPDEDLATTVFAAAKRAMARGAAHDAVELGEHALRLTPPGSVDRIERMLALAEYLEVVGDVSRIRELLEPHLQDFPPGSSRARAHLRLSAATDAETKEHHLDRALAESEHDPALRATALDSRAILFSGIRVCRFEEAEAALHEALPFAKRAGDDVEGVVLHTLAWIGMLRGRPIELALRRLGGLRLTPIHESDVDHLVAQELAFRGEVDRARPLFRRLLAQSDERGEGRYARIHYQLCGLELRAGNTTAAARLLGEFDEWAGFKHTDATRDRFRAVLVATRGLAGEAEEVASGAIDELEATGYVWGRLDAQRARGIARLAAAEPARAVDDLRPIWEHTVREGIDNPGVFPVAPDLVAALIELGDLGEAAAVTRRLRELAEGQEHPWGLPSARRCDALIRVAETRDDESFGDLREAAGAYGRLGLHFDAARTMLELGRAARRSKKWRVARTALEDAASAFDKLGSEGWSEQARGELARVGARRRQPARVLTAAEENVLRLAAAGSSNKEIAQALHVTVSTVEAHLKHTYAKLGVHTRAKATAEAARLGLIGEGH